MAAMEAARISDPTREHATLAAVIDGAGQGKTRILEELQACADIPLWPTLLKLKLGLGSEALQVGLSMMVSLHVVMATPGLRWCADYGLSCRFGDALTSSFM